MVTTGRLCRGVFGVRGIEQVLSCRDGREPIADLELDAGVGARVRHGADLAQTPDVIQRRVELHPWRGPERRVKLPLVPGRIPIEHGRGRVFAGRINVRASCEIPNTNHRAATS